MSVIVRPDRRVISRRDLLLLPAGFEDRFNNHSLLREDVSALRRNLQLRLADVAGVRRARRHDRFRRSTYVVVVPRNVKEASLMNFFKKQDYIAPYKDWPERMRRLSIVYPKDDRTRFLMAVYYGLLGLSPDLSREFILAERATANEGLIPGNYSRHQRDHLERCFALLSRPGYLNKYSQLVGSEQ